MDVTAPIRKEIRVSVPPARAFEIFFNDLPSWWPIQTHSVYGEDATVRVEPGAEGRIVEHRGDEENEWARFRIWEPPHRVVMTWNPSVTRSGDTEVEVRFVEDGDGTRVELEHRGWERIGEMGKQVRGEYADGWDPVLARFVDRTA